MKMPPPLPQHRPRASWPAIAISIAACPGLGQFLQRRKFAGTVLTTIAMISGGWLIGGMLVGIYRSLVQAMNTGRNDFFAMYRNLATPAILFGLAWLVSTIDVLLAHWMLSRKKV